jgi:iron complex transport system substrate-binding protein
MKNFFTFAIICVFLTFLSFFTSCTPPAQEKKQVQQTLGDTLTRYSTQFTWVRMPDWEMVSVKNGEETQTVMIARRELNNSKEKRNQGISILKKSLQRFACLSHTQAGMLRELEAEALICGLNEIAFLPDSLLLARVKKGEIQDIGRDGNLEREVLLTAKPDVVLHSESPQEAENKFSFLASQNTLFLPFLEWKETSPLARAEWLLFLGVLTGKADLALKKFKKIETKYLGLAQKAKNASLKPKVLWQVPYRGVWYVPAGQSYVAKLLEDAGANYPWAAQEGTGSLSLDVEAVFSEGQDADFWLSAGTHRSIKSLLAQDTRFQEFKAVKKKKVFTNQRKALPNGGNPYWVEGAVHPERILADLLFILHPEIIPEHTLYYYSSLE